MSCDARVRVRVITAWAFTNGHVGVVLLLGLEQQDFSCDRSVMSRDARVRVRVRVGVITACYL